MEADVAPELVHEYDTVPPPYGSELGVAEKVQVGAGGGGGGGGGAVTVTSALQVADPPGLVTVPVYVFEESGEIIV